jgi:hypothetical protein
MYLFRRSTQQQPSKEDIAKSIRTLICVASRTLYLDTQRLAIMRHFEPEYCRNQFNALSSDCVTLSVFCIQHSRKKLDYGRIWSKWLVLRNILAKYLGEENAGIKEIDETYRQTHTFKRQLPEFKYDPRPDKKLKEDWWEHHPDREGAMTSMAHWWGEKEARPISFHEFE